MLSFLADVGRLKLYATAIADGRYTGSFIIIHESEGKLEILV